MAIEKGRMIREASAKMDGMFDYRDVLRELKKSHPRETPGINELCALLNRAPFLKKCGFARTYTFRGDSTKIRLYIYQGDKK